MQLKKLKVGSVTLPNNVLLAPLAGYTDFAFRDVCLSLGAGLAYTEMVSCKGLMYNNENTKDLLVTGKNEKIKAVQIFGCDPDIMSRAIQSEHLEKFDIIDINMGCPVPKLFKNGEGSALLNNIHLAEKVVSACAKIGRNITVKFRTGIDKNRIVAVDFAKMCEESGAKMITLHGRTREDYYSGEIDYTTIEKVKNSVSIPLIANGGIYTKQDADIVMEKTCADGVMIARGALCNPFVFSEITGKEITISKLEMIENQIDDMLTYFEDGYVTRVLRKLIAFYIKGEKNSRQFKLKLFSCNTTNELKETLKEIY